MTTRNGTRPEVTNAEALERRDGELGATWIDVREQDEWDARHIEGTVHIPMARALTEIVERWPDPATPLTVSCAVGGRSGRVVDALRDAGYTDVVNVAGGINAWLAEGRPVVGASGFTPRQLERYSRHVPIPEVGLDGQRKLLNSRVLLLGAGGLGAPAALYLAAAGVGTIGIVDDDVVELSNLQRQVVHGEDRLGMPKAESAKRTLANINPDVTVETFPTRLTNDNVFDVIDRGWDVVVDGTDNLPTRYMLNDATVLRGIPVVHGSIYRFEGQVTVFHPFHGPCYRCLYPEPPPPELAPSCAAGGVLGVLPGIVGSLQAVETVKLLLGIGETLAGRLLMYDALACDFTTLKVRRDPSCPACGDGERMSELVDYEEFCAVGRG
jgi:molybdopterin/thiamine biosynthesis adenylyltransferase/rhodanese-related sulfurtransferase